MATPKYYRIKVDQPGWFIREGITHKGKIVVSLCHPSGKQIGDHYVGDDGHEFQMAARDVLSRPEAVQWLGDVREVGERVHPAEAVQIELRSLLARAGCGPRSVNDTASLITKLFQGASS